MRLILTIGLVFSLTWFSDASAQKLKWKEKRSCKRIESAIGYLASDRLEGRSTGSEGEKLSAEYIASEFERLGLTPSGEDGYFQKFSVTTLRIADGSSVIKINGKSLQLFTDYYPLSYSANTSDVNTGAVDVGFGISGDRRDDYANVDATNAVVLINISSPDGIHPHSAWVEWHGINARVDQAIKHGAKGVIFYRANNKTALAESELSLKMRPSSIPVIFLTKPFEDTTNVAFAQIKLKILTDEDVGHNVLGFKDNGASNTVIIGGHHDHLGRGEHGGSLGDENHDIHNGADDNASGISAMLEIARALRKQKKWNANNNYLFIAFSGEEMGLLGSKYFVNYPTLNLKSVNYMVNLDMVGMLDSTTKKLIINGVGTGSYWKESIDRLEVEKRGIDKVETTEGGIGPSDHTSFYLKDIPAIHFFTGAHEHYHKPSDDIENLNLAGEVFVWNYILSMIKDLNSQPKQSFIQTTQADSASRTSSRGSFKVTLGIVPNYSYEGEGLEIDAVRDGKPAHKAGVQAGDVIISFNNQAISSMSDYMGVLKKLNIGDSCPLQIRRKGEVISLTVQF